MLYCKILELTEYLTLQSKEPVVGFESLVNTCPTEKADRLSRFWHSKLQG